MILRTLCSLVKTIEMKRLPVLVDSHPNSVYENTRSAIAYGISPVVGTTGLTPSQIKIYPFLLKKHLLVIAIIPNFL